MKAFISVIPTSNGIASKTLINDITASGTTAGGIGNNNTINYAWHEKGEKIGYQPTGIKKTISKHIFNKIWALIMATYLSGVRGFPATAWPDLDKERLS